MPMIPSPFGVLPYLAVKLVGYSLAGEFLNRRYARSADGETRLDPEPLVLPVVFGASRTALGVVGGLLAVTVESAITVPDEWGRLPFFAILTAARLAEWALVIWLFYERQQPRGATWRYALLGTLLSYGLDLPGWALWDLTPGAFFWC